MSLPEATRPSSDTSRMSWMAPTMLVRRGRTAPGPPRFRVPNASMYDTRPGVKKASNRPVSTIAAMSANDVTGTTGTFAAWHSRHTQGSMNTRGSSAAQTCRPAVRSACRTSSRKTALPYSPPPRILASAKAPPASSQAMRVAEKPGVSAMSNPP